MPKAIFFTRLPADTAALLADQAPPEITVETHPMSMPDAEKAKLAADADFLILFPGHIGDEVIRAAKNVKLIQLVSVGFDQMNLPLCAELGIPVANNGGTNALDVAEHTIAMVLALYRRFVEMDHNVRTNNWRGIDSGGTTYCIDGKTVGLIGLGQIGQRVARLMRAFGATVIYYDAYPAKAEVEQELGVERVTLDELLKRVDILSLHVPLNESTQGLINERSLALMKPNAIIVNTCRGPVIEEAALAAALKSGQIAGAALDVMVSEPPATDNPLLQLDNVLFTPHTAGVTRDTWARRGKFIFANLQRAWAGEKPLATI